MFGAEDNPVAAAPMGDGALPDKPRRRPAAGAAPLPGPRRLDEVDLGLIWLVVDEMIAGRAVPAGLDRGAARGVPGRVRRVGVSGSPVGQQPERPGQFLALGGQLVG